MAYMISVFFLLLTSFCIFFCVMYLNSVLNSETTTYFFNYFFFFIGLLQLGCSLSAYFFVGRSARLILDRSLLYHLTFKACLAIIYIIAMFSLSA